MTARSLLELGRPGKSLSAMTAGCESGMILQQDSTSDVVDRQQVIQEAAAAAMVPPLVHPPGNQEPDRRLQLIQGVKCYELFFVIDIQEK